MSCRKLRLSLLAVGICLCIVFIVSVEAQLNFSTGWGKRMILAAGDRGYGNETPNTRAFANYYRRMMEGEPKRRSMAQA